MILTEEEAKTKDCPVGKMRGSYDGNWDKGYCIGSRCMAWRWYQFEYAAELPLPEYVTHGYCGLAGG